MEATSDHKTPADKSQSVWPHLFEPFRTAAASVANFFSPSADAANAENAYEINMELPGVAPEDIDVSLHDHVLTIKGEKKNSREEKTKTYYFTERSYGAFQRSFRLPGDVDASDIGADFNDGVLTLTLPKTSPAKREEEKIAVRRG
ncbi:MAG: Hsp20/alpha crystallin family protein [Rhodospirillaceae bacterium]|nr:Hsp20/alpha crystallin family protein [Rhodospirillaceae bacterium]MDD9918648.1 Hsp20/alpha crystallin family protein [Rhodospirillaceae bacterium]MDD9925757.1 Hsp20/alpha crystallin family protein [Rhodospirillaceae bacterium]